MNPDGLGLIAVGAYFALRWRQTGRQLVEQLGWRGRRSSVAYERLFLVGGVVLIAIGTIVRGHEHISRQSRAPKMLHPLL
jgi:hypothetical protein